MKKANMIMFAASVLIAVLAHVFFLKEWTDGRYMTGSGDGIAQMAVFKKLLFEQYMHGRLFYSYSFGLGGGVYSQLGYYFSTSFLFLCISSVVRMLQLIHLTGQADVLFWAQASVYISIAKLSFIIFTAACVFRYLVKKQVPAFIGAVLYGVSIIFFRHEVYWDFFTDSMLWLPMLVYGAEKIIRERKPAWFIFACALTLINNFYFAYINLIFIGIYILFRWMIRFEEAETGKLAQCRIFILSGLLGFGISAVSFIPVVYGYLNNLRPKYAQHIDWVDFSDNILFSSRIIILPAIFLLFLFTISLYKYRLFRLFAGISLLYILFHFSPFAASAFNGFSAPQNRFEYVLCFTVAGTAAAGLSKLSEVRLKDILVSAVVVIMLYWNNVRRHSLDITEPANLSIILLLALTIAALLAAKTALKRAIPAVYAIVILTAVLTANTYEKYALSEGGKLYTVSNAFLTGADYKGSEQSGLIQRLQKKDPDPYARVDWMNGVFNNTPIIYGFNGFSVYSSILNRNLLSFYWNDLQIDMGRESVSRYATLGNRSNLYSLLYGKYYMTEKTNEANVPYGFTKVMESSRYAVYQNQYTLPFVRTADHVYKERDLEKAPPLVRERAMLDGIITESGGEKMKQAPTVKNLIHNSSVTAEDADYHNGILTVNGEGGGLKINPHVPSKSAGDYYVSFYLKNKAKDQGFTLKVNDYTTTRKSNKSIYKTGVNDLTIRVPKTKTINIRLPKGTYQLDSLALYEENYQTLKSAYKKAGKEKQADISWRGNKLHISYQNTAGAPYIMLPVPYEKGWELTINGKQGQVEKADYAFIGFKAQKGKNDIELTYYPPYFKPASAVSVISLVLAVIYARRQKKPGS
ncbi:YfhO family protein [Bacillus sp. ISL-51]|uniref:YfhO family protein n=1 Tax=Bacteria TaxID=2 RepID=UPI001BEBECF0|nr:MULTISPECIES: YfhO family protein [Bacteria]MBT2572394.1 YfhO family protein [Bacillus sp. ISL-51]MBT2634330.1 YfhO family protein [Bacillus sp. ISL-26]MBT2711455.1 YfhO family protein [Pseudomonas sp. ISL-88]